MAYAIVPVRAYMVTANVTPACVPPCDPCTHSRSRSPGPPGQRSRTAASPASRSLTIPPWNLTAKGHPSGCPSLSGPGPAFQVPAYDRVAPALLPALTRLGRRDPFVLVHHRVYRLHRYTQIRGHLHGATTRAAVLVQAVRVPVEDCPQVFPSQNGLPSQVIRSGAYCRIASSQNASASPMDSNARVGVIRDDSYRTSAHSSVSPGELTSRHRV